jgi:HYR domain
MMKTGKKTGRACAALMVVGIALGCSEQGHEEKGREGVSSNSSALSSSNGIWSNGLASNGIWSNGIWSNGIWSNGIWSNGIWSNGIWSNGIWSNGIWSNGIWSNGIWSNGIWSNGIWSNGLTGDAAVPGNALRSNQYARQLMTYLYACAMPPATQGVSYDTSLDPNNGTLKCTPPGGGAGDGGAPDAGTAGGDAGVGCAAGYTCSSEGTCVVPLIGMIGVGVNADGTTWWESGQCDESCQRWVSACLLARTNAYGTKVAISLRAPAVVPPGRKAQFDIIQANLATTADELAEFQLREGAYYGNLFATTPVNPPPSPTVGPDGGLVPYSGPSTGALSSTPSFNACAGPGSNIPLLTKRFCSSPGDQTLINVPGVCVTTGSEAGVCDGIDDPVTGAIDGCLTKTGEHYDEVLTVYLKAKIGWCGDGVCTGGEDTTSCPSDCLPGWAKDFPPTSGFGADLIDAVPGTVNAAQQGMSAVGPDGAIVVLGHPGDPQGPGGALGSDLGYGTVPRVSADASLTKYDSLGNYVWGIHFAPGAGLLSDWNLAGGVTVDATGNIIVVGSAVRLPTYDGEFPGAPFGFSEIWTSTFSSDGAPMGAYSLQVGALTGNSFSDITLTRAVALDPQGNVVLAAGYCGNMTFQLTNGQSVSLVNDCDPNAPNGSQQRYGVFVAKISPQAGPGGFPSAGPVWVSDLSTGGSSGSSGGLVGLSLVVDGMVMPGNQSSDHDIVVLIAGPQGPQLQKLSGDDGSLRWPAPKGPASPGTAALYTFATVDAQDDIYVTGYFQAGADFGCGATSGSGVMPFLAKLDPAGSCIWETHANIVCPPSPPGTPPCGGVMVPPGMGLPSPALVAGMSIGFDNLGGTGNGNVILGSFGNPTVAGGVNNPNVAAEAGIDFGVGTFPTYHSNNIFISAYSPDTGKVIWAKQIQTVLSSFLLGMAIDPFLHVVVSGNYSGQMGVNNTVLTTTWPDNKDIVDSFLASFSLPSLTNTALPQIGKVGIGGDETDPTIDTMPKDIVVQATSAAGASVFYALPTVIDNGHDGTSVACSPPPDTNSDATFPLGETLVTCTASDPIGHHDSKTFKITVIDTLSPLFSPYGDITAQATSASGAKVPYPATPGNPAGPTATDQVDGNVTPVCVPTSGSSFVVGTTLVTCTASDLALPPNTATATFNVVVKGPTFGGACTSAADCGTGGNCVDGVCCNSACGGGDPSDCQACSKAAGGSVDGTCTPVSAGSVCRKSGGTCDVAESCDGTSLACPADGFLPSSTICRASAGVCDAAETCTGTSAACPANAFVPATTICRASAGVCDAAETCTGTSAACPANAFAPATTVCRASAGVCDAAETCTGSSAACPADAFAPATTVCRASAGVCDAAETCTGSSAACPADAFAPSTTICRAAAGACDVAEKCSGSAATCPADKLVAAGTVCQAAANVCQTAAVCSGAGTSCPALGTIAGCKPPVVTVPANITAEATSATGAKVTFTVTAKDWHGASLTPTCSPSSGSTFALGTKTVTCTAKDASGQVGSASFTVTVKDTKGPVFCDVPGTVTAYATTTSGAKVSYTKPTASDAVDGSRTVTCSLASGAQFPVNKTTVSCTASDKSGNTTTATFTVWVTYQAPTDGTFFLSPIRSNGSSVFKIGNPLGVRFKLSCSTITNLVAKLAVTKLSTTIQGTTLDTSTDTVADTGLTFHYDPTAKNYVYRWKTSDQTQGTFQLKADLGDGVVHQINVSLKP